MAALKVRNIDNQRMVMRIEHGKGGKERYVILSEALLGILRNYWRLARPPLFLFPGRTSDTPIDTTVLHAACRSATAAAGLDKRVSVHVLRHMLRHPSAGKRRQHPHHPGVARSREFVDDSALHARLHAAHWQYRQPVGSALAERDAAGIVGDARPAFELADVFRRHGETYAQLNAGHLGRVERRVTAAIAACRTAALGGHVERCDDCGLTRIAYNSCRNRHCPKCQGAARAKWLAAHQAELPPVPYFHVVFTLPPAVAEIAFQNKRTVYGLLMRAAAQALTVLAAKRLGARIGLIPVLHTWGQTLTHHPHVHCLVPGGGVALDGKRWIEAKPNFLLSVHALSKTFRRMFLDGLMLTPDRRKRRIGQARQCLSRPRN